MKRAGSGVVSIAFACLGVLAACSSGSKAATASACDQVFDDIYTKCISSAPPASELSRLRQRYEQVCEHGLALPGVSVTAAELSDCANRVASNGCRSLALLASCVQPGTLTGGAPCSDGLQCQSNQCAISGVLDDGGLNIPGCGSCEPIIAVGQPCGIAAADGQCVAGSQCDTASATPTCVTVTYGDVGASCHSSDTCKAGLYCDSVDSATARCATPGASAGTPCTEPDGCVYPLACLGTPPNQACANPGAAGAPCVADADCVSGLGCDPTARMCGAITWAAGGQPCGNLVRCLVGNCPGASGQCPAVIPDGQPCNQQDSSRICDTFASCTNETCTLIESAACK